MSIKSAKGAIKLLLLLFLLFPQATPLLAQAAPSAAEIEMVQADDAESREIKAEKKKEKDLIEINARFFITLAIDLAVVLLIITFIYYPNYRKMDTIFTFLVFNIVIFLLTFVMNKVKLSMGAAFGLFAVFSMLRYRTAGIDLKDMTYLFVFIALGLVGGIQLEYQELLVISGIVVLLLAVLDTRLILKKESSQGIEFEKVEMIKPELRQQLIAELEARTGHKIHRISIRKLDYLRDVAAIRIYYYE